MISFKLLFHSQAARRGRRSSASSQRATDLCIFDGIELAPPAASLDLDAEEVLVVGAGLFEQLEALGLDVDALLDNVVSRDHQILGADELDHHIGSLGGAFLDEGELDFWIRHQLSIPDRPPGAILFIHFRFQWIDQDIGELHLAIELVLHHQVLDPRQGLIILSG